MEADQKKFFFFNLLLFVGVFILLAGGLEISLRIIGRTSDNFLKQDPVLGWTHLSNKDGWSVTGEYKVPVHLNNFGLVGPDINPTLERSINSFRIAFVGDSLTEAFQVNPEAAFPRVIEERLRGWTGVTFGGVEALNFGVTSYGTVKEEWVIENQVFKFKPDLIVLGFFVGNDFADNLHEHINPEAKFTSWQKLKNETKLWFRNHSTAYRWILEKKARLNFSVWRPTGKKDGSPLGAASSASAEEISKTEEYLKKIKNLTDQRQIPLLVLILPSKEQVHGQWRSSADSPPDPEEPNMILKEFFDQEKIAYLDTLPNFQSWAKMNPDGLAFFKFDGHPNETGHLLIAQALIDYLIK